jgi:hypothetical protein
LGSPLAEVTRKGARDLILTSSLFDQAWYELVAGARFRSRRAAVEHYLRHVDRGWSPHPLFEAVWLFPQGGWRRSSADPLSHYLRSDARLSRSPHPLIDLDRLTDQLSHRLPDPLTDRAPAPEGPYLGDLGPVDRWLRTAVPVSPVPVPASARPVSWGELRRALEAAESQAVALAPEGPERPEWLRTPHAGRVSVVLPVHGAPGNTVGWIRSLFREHPGVDLEVIACVADGREHRALATAVALAAPAARVVGLPRDSTWAEAANHGLGEASGETVVFLRASAAPTYWSWLDPLRRRLDDEGIGTCQPLLLSADRTIAAAGASFLTSVLDETPLLHAHASADATRLRNGEIPAVWAVLACRAATARALGGFDIALRNEHAEVDLSVRARREGYGVAGVVAESVLILRDDDRFNMPPDPPSSSAPEAPELIGASTAAWAEAGYSVAVDETSQGGRRVVPLRPASIHEQPPRLRWTIDTAATGGLWSQFWGDWHFASSLASALERIGQHVTVDSRESRERTTREFDDVVVALRGLDRVTPRGSPLHVLWVISHPDLVTASECREFDLVFAASSAWADAHTQAWRLPIRPLLQCTDPRLFHPTSGEPDTGEAVVFVGKAHGGMRPAVEAALAANCDLALYGAGWEDLVPASVLRSSHVPNTEVGSLYASAGVVLNDHWPDMRRAGFVSNRVFDAVACGARVVTDDLAGIEELFPGSVRRFGTPSELAELATPPYLGFADRTRRLANVAAAAVDHSFDKRASQLLDAVAHASSVQSPRARRAGS